MGQRRSGLFCAAAVVLVIDLLVVAVHTDDGVARGSEVAAAKARAASLPMVDADSPLPRPLLEETTTTTAPTTTEPPTTTAPPPPPAPPVQTRGDSWTVGPYRGTGVWIDVYDWTSTITNGRPTVGPAQVDQMAAFGIQTIYIQTAHRRSPADVLDPELLLPIIERAHLHGIAVVAWYLPELIDTTYDLNKVLAAARLPVDGVGIDIESRAVGDVNERNRRLIELSEGMRRNLGSMAMSAITLDAVHLQAVNPSFWPAFPWPELGRLYDVIVPMAYWSGRKSEWRSGDRYTAENIERIRAATGRPDMPIHIAGGIADGISLDDVAGMVHAIHMRGAIGGSLYDWNTSHGAQWDLLRALRVG